MKICRNRSLYVALTAFFLLLCALIPPNASTAQGRWHIGVHGGLLRAWHVTEQHVLPGGSECGSFGSGRGESFEAGVLAELEFTTWLRGVGSVSYARLGGMLRTTCDNGIIVPSGNGNEFVPLLREYQKDVTLDYGLFELGLRLQPTSLPVHIGGSISIGRPLFKASWAQDERIVSPAGALFPDFTASRSNGSGDFQNTQLRTAIVGTIGVTLPVRSGMEFSPRLRYSWPLTDVIASAPWSIDYASAGIAITWTIEPRAPEVLPPPPPPPAPVEVRREPVAMIGSDADASIDIVETFVTETFPLLPYVFFNRDSDQLPEKYREMVHGEADAFSESTLPRNTLGIYYRLLDIVGYRMRANPAITILLLGSTDGKDAERDNSALGQGRARVVRDYLERVWSIDTGRMRIETRGLPEIPSTQQLVEGDEENRRVDIHSEYDEVFRPVVHERLSEFTITPPTMQLALGANSTAELELWRLELRHAGRSLATYGGFGAPPQSLQWTLSDSVAQFVGTEDSLVAMLDVTDKYGMVGRSTHAIPIRKRQNSYEVGRLSLIVFDFDRSDILPHNQRMIRRFVAEAIKATSDVVITGSTDRLGEAEHNLTLSTARAENVKALLLSQHPSFRSLQSRGIGEAPELYDNALPEGRFYCRTVAVEVRTPVAAP